jgi:hypothetical protein
MSDQSAPGSPVPAEAIEAAEQAVYAVIGLPRLPSSFQQARTYAQAALTAAAPVLRADQTTEPEGFRAWQAGLKAGATAERERIFRTPVTQRFVTDDCLLRCAGCEAELNDGRMAHNAGCSEMRLADLLTAAPDGASDD